MSILELQWQRVVSFPCVVPTTAWHFEIIWYISRYLLDVLQYTHRKTASSGNLGNINPPQKPFFFLICFSIWYRKDIINMMVNKPLQKRAAAACANWSCLTQQCLGADMLCSRTSASPMDTIWLQHLKLFLPPKRLTQHFFADTAPSAPEGNFAWPRKTVLHFAPHRHHQKYRLLMDEVYNEQTIQLVRYLYGIQLIICTYFQYEYKVFFLIAFFFLK